MLAGMNNMPPGPSPLLFPWYVVDPNGFYAHCQARFGDVFTCWTPFGRVVVTGSPAGARSIFTAQPETFCAFQPEMLSPFLGPRSVIVLSGAEHKRERKLLAPPFHGDRMRAYGQIMAEVTRHVVEEIEPGTPFKMLEVTQRIALDVMCHAVLDIDVGVEPDRAQAVRDAVFGHVRRMVPPLIYFPQLRRPLLGLGPWDRFVRARDNLDALVREIIAARREELVTYAHDVASGRDGLGRVGPTPEDILALLLSSRYDDGSPMSDQEVRDELLSLLFAGHETTAIGLAWALYHLHRDPWELGQVTAEIAQLGPSPAPEQLVRAPRLEAVCKEALRLETIVVDIPRVTNAPFNLLGFDLPVGTAVSVSPLLLHRRPESFPDPYTFRPTRFIEGHATRKPSELDEFVPFGGGARRCIGAAFALYEMKVVLGTMLSHYRFAVDPADVETPLRREFVMTPKHGVRMMLLPAIPKVDVG
jgi:cytochrome P450